jgi:hypothetical protein
MPRDPLACTPRLYFCCWISCQFYEVASAADLTILMEVWRVSFQITSLRAAQRCQRRRATLPPISRLSYFHTSKTKFVKQFAKSVCCHSFPWHPLDPSTITTSTPPKINDHFLIVIYDWIGTNINAHNISRNRLQDQLNHNLFTCFWLHTPSPSINLLPNVIVGERKNWHDMTWRTPRIWDKSSCTA